MSLSVFYNFICIVFIAVMVLSNVCVLIMSPFYLFMLLADNCFKAMVFVKGTVVPALTQTSNLTSIRVLYGKVTFANKFSLSLKIFIVNRNKFPLGFDNIYPENNQRVPRQC